MDATATRLKGGALTWVNARIHDAEALRQPPFTDWAAFRAAFIAQFEPLASEETARAQIRAHTQTGSVQAYLYRFQELKNLIPSMNTVEAYNLNVSGLKQEIRQMMGTLVPKGDLEQAMQMTQRSQAYGSAGSGRQEFSSRAPQQGGFRGRRSQVSNIENAEKTEKSDSQPQPTAEVNFTRGGRSRKFKTGDKPEGAGTSDQAPSRRKAGRKFRERRDLDRSGKECFFCRKIGHFMAQCPEIENLRKQRGGGSGNA